MRVDVCRCFNPFSFRSPSKLPQDQLWSVERVSIPSPSGLLQNAYLARYRVEALFQSLLLQVSFKTGNPQDAYSHSRFQSLLLQVSFKTLTHSRRQLRSRFNPFSFRSPSKRFCSPKYCGYHVSIPSPSGLLQNAVCSASTLADAVSIPSPSGLLQNDRGRCGGRIAGFQSLLLQVSFKTELPGGFCIAPAVSIPSPSGLLQNRKRPQFYTSTTVSIPSPSGLLQNFFRRRDK